MYQKVLFRRSQNVFNFSANQQKDPFNVLGIAKVLFLFRLAIFPQDHLSPRQQGLNRQVARVRNDRPVDRKKEIGIGRRIGHQLRRIRRRRVFRAGPDF
jgi:hypothetical protein